MRVRGSRSWTDVGIAAVVIVVLAGPVLFTRRPFQADSTNGLWMGSVMRASLSHGFPPSYFLNTNSAPISLGGVFNPMFAFYGGPLFAGFGLLIGALGGNVAVGGAVLVLLAFSAAYGGTFWLARQCGLRDRLAHVPALVVVSAAYYLTDLYGRGDIPEFVALSTIPLLVASISYAVRAPSLTPGPVALLFVSVIIFTGSHNLTLLWTTLVGTVVLAVLGAILRPHGLRFRRLGVVAGLVALAAMVNGWFLLPDVAFAGSTYSAKLAGNFFLTYFDTLSLLLHPGRAAPAGSPSPALYVQAPVWFLGWAFVCGAWIWWKRSFVDLRKVWTALAVLLGALVFLIVDSPLWKHLPRALRAIQFPYRLNGFVLLLVAALVLVSLLAVQREVEAAGRTRVVSALVVSLIGVTAISSALAIWQEWVPASCPGHGYLLQCAGNRTEGTAETRVYPATWYASNAYANGDAPLVAVARGRSFDFSPNRVDAHGDHLAGLFAVPAGTDPFVTNVMGGPQLVSITGGIERLGRNRDGYVVVRRTAPGGSPVRVVIKTADTAAIRFGRWLSIFGLVGTALVWFVLAGQQVRRRRRSPS